MERTAGTLIVILVILLLACLGADKGMAQTDSPFADECHSDREGQRGSGVVVALLDARTLQLEDGRMLRLIGILPPYRPVLERRASSISKHDLNAAWRPMSKTRAALSALVVGRSVAFISGQRKKDRYGRLPAQVFVKPRVNDSIADEAAPGQQQQRTAQEKPTHLFWVQAYLVANGLARAYAQPGNALCISQLIALEDQARKARIGFWRDGTFRVHRVANIEGLRRLVGSYQIVEGRVLRQGRSRSRVYLNFGTDWRRDFTIGIELRLMKTFANAGVDVKKLRTRFVRIRGWLSWRRGPFIDAVTPAQIELLPQ